MAKTITYQRKSHKDMSSTTRKSPKPYLMNSIFIIIDKTLKENTHGSQIKKYTRRLIHPNSSNQTKQTPYTKKLVCKSNTNNTFLKSNILTFLKICNPCDQQMSIRGKAVHDAIMGSPTDTTMNDMEDTMVIENIQSKRTQDAKKGGSANKRKKNAELITGLKDTPRDFWLGIVAMENLAIDEGIKAKDCSPPTKKEDLIAMGMKEAEAEEVSQIKKIAFPHVKQLLYPLERPDGKGGQHFNLTQLPIETEVDPGTGLSLDYHVAIHFERPSKDYTHLEILSMATTRLAYMGIELGIGMAEPIYIPCKEKEKNSKVKFWTGTIKIHLRHPKLDGISMLKGLRPFILAIDQTHTLGKVCKCYDSIARNTLLSTKIENPKLLSISSSELQRDVLLESFRRGYDYEIASVQKVKEETWGWLISTTPTQANRIIQYLVPYKHELMKVITPQAAKDERRSRGEGLTEDEIKKKTPQCYVYMVFIR